MTDTIPGALAARVERDPDGPYVRCGGDWLTAERLLASSTRLAGGLAALGVDPGDRVVLLMPNRQEFIEAFFAVAHLGAITVAMNHWLKGEFLAYQLSDCQASVLIADRAGVDAAAAYLDGTSIKAVVLLDPVDGDAPDISGRALVAWSDLAAGSPAPAATVTGADVAGLLYTSGTTGLPKACMLPHGAYAANATVYREVGMIDPGDRIFTAYPLFHTSGQVISLMAALVNDASIVFEPEFSASTFMARATEEGATVLMGVGPMAAMILAQPADDLDGERRFRVAQFVPLAPAVQAEFEDRFNTQVLSQGYGQTECPPVTLDPVSGDRKPGSAGRPISYLEVAIHDADDNGVTAGEVGEIVVRPRRPNALFLGYWGAPELTISTARNLWHHTGDLGRFDEDGHLFFVDRRKDVVRRRGENISSVQLEAAIASHPQILQAAVCAVPSELGEDDIKVSIVPWGELPAPAELFAFFQDTLPYFAVPRYVDVRSSLPATEATGRTLKHVLRAEGLPEGIIDFEALGLRVERSDRR